MILDLFCGTGTIGQILANQIEGVKVIGVDIVKEAIEDAKRNAKRNKIDNLEFYAADVGKFLKEYPDFENKIGNNCALTERHTKTVKINGFNRAH